MENEIIWMKKSALMGGASRKVLSWIHGGTFNFGGVDVIYESPSKLVDEQDLIVAKMNYRLGPFGNWYFPMNIGGQPKSSWSIQDQQMGLKWIKDNIGKFNGDDQDITLGGSSAGGMAVMIHITTPESHDLFHNALVIGAPQAPFWSGLEALNAYGHITTEILSCATAENFVEKALNGELLGCLQGIPTEQFAAIMGQAGDVFKFMAVQSGKLSQLEQPFAINIDGETVMDDMHKLFSENSPRIKSDMGFYLQEISANEGTSMTQNLFTNTAFKQQLFGENYSVIFQALNEHVVVPKPAHDGLMATMYGAAGEEFMEMLLNPAALGCPGVENDPYGGLLTECKEKTADWVTSWLWHCNIRNSHAGYAASPLYMVQFSAAYPGPDHQEDGVMLPDTAGVNDCYEAGQEKSCHIVGQAYLFGESTIQGVAETAEQVAFGTQYRQLYADLIKTGNANLLPINQSGGQSNNIDIGMSTNPSDNLVLPYAMTCGLFDMIGSYGLI